MKRILLTASLVLVVPVSVANAKPVERARSGCKHLFTVKYDKQRALEIFSGTRAVSMHDFRELGYMERCQKNRMAHKYVRWFNRYQRALHRARVAAANAPPPMQSAVASWYSLDGVGACGMGAQAGYHVANKTLACGTRLEICRSSCVTAEVADRGPYVAGREFDLNVNVRNAVGCAGVCVVRYRIL